MSSRHRRSLVRRGHEMLLEQEAERLGSLTRKRVEGLQLYRRYGLSYREINEMTKVPLSTIHKYCREIIPEVVYEPGVSLSIKLARMRGDGVVITDRVQEPEVSLSTIIARLERQSVTPTLVQPMKPETITRPAGPSPGFAQTPVSWVTRTTRIFFGGVGGIRVLPWNHPVLGTSFQL